MFTIEMMLKSMKRPMACEVKVYACQNTDKDTHLVIDPEYSDVIMLYVDDHLDALVLECVDFNEVSHIIILDSIP